MQHRALASQIAAVATRRGAFRLRSGQMSDIYFDKYQFEARPDLLRTVAAALQPLIPGDTEVLAGLELGGVPLATALGLLCGLPIAFVRKARKEYGTEQIAEGVSVSGRRVCMIEDVITTGGQVATSARDLRDAGAVINGVLCVIYRGPAQPHIADDASLNVRALFMANDLQEEKRA